MSRQAGVEEEARSPHRTWPLLLPETFDGNGDFDAWIHHFEDVADLNGWSDEEKLRWLKVRLTNKAHVALNRFPHVTLQSFATVRTALYNRFEPDSKRELYKVELENRAKLDNESWADYGDAVAQLVNKVFPDFRDEDQEQIALNYYMKQLTDPQILLAVNQRRPKSIREAVSATMELETYLVTSLDPAVDKVQTEMLAAIQTLLDRVEQLETNLQRSWSEQPPLTQRDDRVHLPVICYRCGKLGHFSKGCAMTKSPKQLTDKQNTIDSKSEQNVPTIISINSVSSYTLLCAINGTPVSFLIDTGAGVSLLKSEVWERVNGNPNTLKPITAHRLVGVDGIPIKVRGSTIAQLTIGGVEFQHEFIIADQITVDALLGVDFLEAKGCLLDLSKGEMSINGKTVMLTSHSTSGSVRSAKVILADTVTIPASSEMEVMACVESSIAGTWLVEHNEFNHQSVCVARALVSTPSDTVPVRIVNTALSPTTLYKNSKIATAEHINDLEVCTTRENGSTSDDTELNDLLLTHPLPDDITDAQKQQFLALCSLYSDVIASNDENLGRTSVLQHHINTGTSTPVRQAARRIPLPRRDTVRQLLDQMTSKGVISPSKSPWASPIVLVKKKDGTIRFCIDYRKVNNLTVKDAYPLPRVDDTLDTLAGSVWFTTLDLKSGYWQVEVAQEDRAKTAFTTQEGLFEFNVMPFGLCNAPATFQRLMDSVLAGLQWSTCLVYLDDIIIMGRTFNEHLANLQQVFERLKQAGLKLQFKKCQFLQHQVNFLGHIVSSAGILPDPSKTLKVKEWPTPTSVQETQKFLGLANYYRRFVKDFASIAKPLHQLTEKKTPFKWTEQCEDAFAALKLYLTSAPILALPDWSQQFILDTDASDMGIGAVLSQQWADGTEHVICYASRILTKSERNYCVTRKELLAVVTYIQHFRQYLLNSQFIIRTDHGALAWLQQFKEPEGQLARWLEKLQDYNFTIIHRPGHKHSNADALSHYPCRQCGRESHLMEQPILTITTNNLMGGYSSSDMRSFQLSDSCVSLILRAKERGQKPSPDLAKSQSIEYRRLLQQWDQLTIHNGVLYRGYVQPMNNSEYLQLIVPNNLRNEILHETHEGTSGGHLGQEKTLNKLKERFYWPGHYADVQNWCQTCSQCATRKNPPQRHHASLGTVAAGYPTQIMAVDLVGPLVESEKGNSYIMVVGDYFSRWMEAFPIPNQEATTVAEKLVEEIFLRFSVPEQLHSDQGRQFESKLITEICQLLNIHKTRTTPHHPQSDGLVERFNRTLLDMLSTCAKDHPFDWEQYIRKVCMAYNSSVQSSTGYTPFYLMFGRQARLPLDVMFETNIQTQSNNTPGEYAIALQKRLRTAYDLVRKQLSDTHIRQKQFYDQKVHGKPYKPGDLVWLHSAVARKGRRQKLNHQWTGPFKIVKKLSDATYRIQNTLVRTQRKVVHFDWLKPCPSNMRFNNSTQSGPPQTDEQPSLPPNDIQPPKPPL